MIIIMESLVLYFGLIFFQQKNVYFSASVFREAFSSLKGLETHVLYPSLNTDAFDKGMRGTPTLKMAFYISKPL